MAGILLFVFFSTRRALHIVSVISCGFVFRLNG